MNWTGTPLIGKTRVLLDASPRFEPSYSIEHFWEDEITRPYRKSTHQNTGYGQTMTTNETFRFPMYRDMNAQI